MIEKRALPLNHPDIVKGEVCVVCGKPLQTAAFNYGSGVIVFEVWENNKFDYTCSWDCAEREVARQTTINKN